jgi:hypothetical protein
MISIYASEKRKKADRKKNLKTDGKKLKNTDKVC